MNVNDIIVDVATLGDKPYTACSCKPMYEYVDNKRTDKLLGYRVNIVLKHLEHTIVGIKIPTLVNPLPNMTDDVLVDFDNLQVGEYLDNYGRPKVYGYADSVKIINADATKSNIKLSSKNETID